MTRTLKVYGWTGYDPQNVEGHNKQTREIVAAHSIAEVTRIADITRYEFNTYGSETGNSEEIALAMSDPGVVFFRGINDRNGNWKRRGNDEH